LRSIASPMNYISFILFSFAASQVLAGPTPVKCRVGLSEAGREITGYYFSYTKSLSRNVDCGTLPAGYFLVTGQIHGNEKSTGVVLNEIVKKSYVDSFPGGVLIIPVVNVDGDENNTRQNQSGVDLNRNFPTRLIFEGKRALTDVEFPGSLSYRAPEMTLLSRIIKKSAGYLDLHGYLNKVYAPLSLSSFDSSDKRFLEHLKSSAIRLAQLASRILGVDYSVVDGFSHGDIGSSDEYGVFNGVLSACLEMPETDRNIYQKTVSEETAHRYAQLISDWFHEVNYYEKDYVKASSSLDTKKYSH
jgi:predicted deacylase